MKDSKDTKVESKKEEEKESKEEFFYYDRRTKIYINDINRYIEMGKVYGKDYKKTKVKVPKGQFTVVFKINNEKIFVKRVLKFIEDIRLKEEYSIGYWKFFFIKEPGKVWSKIDEEGYYIGPALNDLIEGRTIPLEPPIGFKNAIWNNSLKKWEEKYYE